MTASLRHRHLRDRPRRPTPRFLGPEKNSPKNSVNVFRLSTRVATRTCTGGAGASACLFHPTVVGGPVSSSQPTGAKEKF
jgi:hypothetical protein